MMRKKQTVTPGEYVVADPFTLVDEGLFFEILCLKENYDKLIILCAVRAGYANEPESPPPRFTPFPAPAPVKPASGP